MSAALKCSTSGSTVKGAIAWANEMTFLSESTIFKPRGRILLHKLLFSKIWGIGFKMLVAKVHFNFYPCLDNCWFGVQGRRPMPGFWAEQVSCREHGLPFGDGGQGNLLCTLIHFLSLSQWSIVQTCTNLVTDTISLRSGSISKLRIISLPEPSTHKQLLGKLYRLCRWANAPWVSLNIR